MFDVGVVLPTRLGAHAQSHEALLRIAEAFDENDVWHHLWVTDSIIAPPFYDSIVLLAACAARTTRVRVDL
jgi:alkanesulfonate monooxygenase SsuD/methylene tetrahydromethanopterin reductase-like flavin-dependent oxidoreductase (luciferase family)